MCDNEQYGRAGETTMVLTNALTDESAEQESEAEGLVVPPTV